MSVIVDPRSVTDRDSDDLDWVDVRQIVNQRVKVYFENIEPAMVDALRRHVQYWRFPVRITYTPDHRLVISCQTSSQHEVVARGFSCFLSNFNRAYGGGELFPVVDNGRTTVDFGSHYSGEPDFSFVLEHRDSSNLIGLVNYGATENVSAFVEEAVAYIKFTTHVMSALMVWIDEIDPINGVFGMVLCEARRIVYPPGTAIPVGARNYMFLPSVSFGNAPLRAHVSAAWLRATSNLAVFPVVDNPAPTATEPVYVTSGLAVESEPTALGNLADPYPLFPPGIVGVGFGGPPCNAVALPQSTLPNVNFYQYRIPGYLLLCEDNRGEVLFNNIAPAEMGDYIIDLFQIQHALRRRPRN